MLLARELSDCKPMLMDMVAMDAEADVISFWHCGMGLPCYADSQGFSVTQYPADPRVFELPGASLDIKFAPQDVTILRLDGKCSQLLVCEAQIVPGPDRGYDGARGWYSHFTMDGKALSCGLPEHRTQLRCSAPLCDLPGAYGSCCTGICRSSGVDSGETGALYRRIEVIATWDFRFVIRLCGPWCSAVRFTIR